MRRKNDKFGLSYRTRCINTTNEISNSFKTLLVLLDEVVIREAVILSVSLDHTFFDQRLRLEIRQENRLVCVKIH